MTDRRDLDPHDIVAYVRDIGAAIDTIVDGICALTAAAQIDRPARPDGPTGGSEVPDPTGGDIGALEAYISSRLHRLVGRWVDDPTGTADTPGLVHDLAAAAADLGVDLDEPLAALDGRPATLEHLVEQLRAAPPISRQLRVRLRALGTALHAILTGAHEGWKALHDTRWTTDPKSQVSRLDQEVVREANRTGGMLLALAGHHHDDQGRRRGDSFTRLARALDAAAGAAPVPAQPAIVYCRNHPDTPAKYRRLGLCAACYQAERRQGDQQP